MITLAYMDGWTYVHTYVRPCTYVRTVDDVMAIKPKFLASMGYRIFLIMVLCARNSAMISVVPTGGYAAVSYSSQASEGYKLKAVCLFLIFLKLLFSLYCNFWHIF